MFEIGRSREIIFRARRDGTVRVKTLADELGVSDETIRRDLADLERQGLVNRVHGGAMPADRPSYEGTLQSRSAQRPEEKARIARSALDELGEAEVIYIDEGSTAAAFAEVLEPDRPMTVVTPSIGVSHLLLSRPHISVIQLAGELRRPSAAVVGQWTVRMLGEIVIDLAFIGANGLTREHGLTVADPAVAGVKRVVLSQSRRSVLLADSTKIGRDTCTAFAHISDVERDGDRIHCAAITTPLCQGGRSPGRGV